MISAFLFVMMIEIQFWFNYTNPILKNIYSAGLFNSAPFGGEAKKNPAISCGACISSNSLFQLIDAAYMPRKQYSHLWD